ncbi:MAG: hypothetical protein L6R40_003219 [Gallowayella cf. fulva]|nr:MAG: hypothetical protein L6R40_003219 [Xanthomendoza cf. fulva]
MADQTILKNFEVEMTNLKRLSHEHLVKVVGSYTDQKSVALLMEPVAQMNLLTFLDQFNPARGDDSPSLRSYFGCLANAVAYLHTQRIRHRDLKPENILVKDFKIYISDFGTSRDWSQSTKDTTTDAGIPTTAPYMAPEIARRLPRNSAADMWSLGVVYLDMITVLRGQSLSKMRKFIASHGTRHPYVYGNGPATTQWFEELRLKGQGLDSDNEPLSWIKDLTQSEPQRRPKPWALTSQIRNSASSTAFIGICCADDDEAHDYPSPPSTANSEDDAPVQEQLDALSLFDRPPGSLMQPDKQSSLEQWRDNVLSDTSSPYSVLPWNGGVFEEPYEMLEDRPVESRGFTTVCQNAETEAMKDHKIIESCYGYDIAEDDSDEEQPAGEDGYEILEDSSGSESTVCPASPQYPAGRYGLPTSEAEIPHDMLPPNSLSSSAIAEQLDSVPEFPEPLESIPSVVAATDSTADPTVMETRYILISDWYVQQQLSKPAETAVKAVSFADTPLPEKGQALTVGNLSKLASSTVVSSTSHPDQPNSTSQGVNAKPKMTAGLYMQEVWEAASTIQTSVLDSKTLKAFARLGPVIVWQDRTQHLVESYAQQGKSAAVRELLLAGCNPGTKKKPRWKPLINAIRAGTQRHNKVVKVLLDHGADVDVKHPTTGKTSLHFAIENPNFPGYTNIIRILIEHGADPNALDKNKDSPLLQILYGGYKPLEKHKRDALACLLQTHIDVNVNIMPLGTLDMPIHLAVRRRDALAVAILIDRGSKVNTPNSTGLTPLEIAASSWSETSSEDDMEVLRYLLQGGARVNEAAHDQRPTALELAARQGCVNAVNLLLSKEVKHHLPNGHRAAVTAVTANKSKMSEVSYAAILRALETFQG